jgi:gamma-glutamylcyclotransferase (GGCT)/AIG2-like uncharacterized protein YtfP
VEGEVYEVDHQMLSNLDRLERHPLFYTRRLEDVTSNKGEFNSWVYYFNKYTQKMLTQEMFVSYASKGPHKLNYVEPQKRDGRELDFD